MKQEEKPKKKKQQEIEGERGELSMTPMIDVTFLLLIFFMVACKFKVFEGKLAAFLPKDVGENPHIVEEPPELPLKVFLRWNAPRKRCRVTVGRIFCGYDSEGIARARQKVRQITQTGLDKAEIEAGGDVRMNWLVQTLNMLTQAGLKEIQFTGSGNPLGS